MQSGALTSSVDTAYTGVIGMHRSAVTESSLLVKLDATGDGDCQTSGLGHVAMTTQSFHS